MLLINTLTILIKYLIFTLIIRILSDFVIIDLFLQSINGLFGILVFRF